MKNKKFRIIDVRLKKRVFLLILGNVIYFSLIFNLLSLILITPTVFADDRGQTKIKNITVSALVPPTAADFQFGMSYKDGSNVPQGRTITYTITYGAKASAALTTADTIVVHYSTNEAPDYSHIVDYVSGSATKGYNEAVPVIDTINRTITWIIPALPPGVVNQTVSFKLGVNTQYTGPDNVTFWNRAEMTNQYVTMPEQSVKQDYHYNSSLVLPGPTATPKPGSATPPPIPTPPPPPISNVEFTGISNTGSTIEIRTSTPSKLTATYGTSTSNLSQTVKTQLFATTSKVALTNLKPDTTYYFRIKTIDLLGGTYTSEQYTFKTAKQTFKQNLANNVIVITTNGNVLLSNIQKQVAGVPPAIVLTPGNDYEISYRLSDQFPLHSIDAVVRSKILGANTYTYAPSVYQGEMSVPMQELKPSFYVADLQTLIPGYYEIYVHVADTQGNIVEQKVADLKVIPFLAVYKAHTGTPINNARVDFSYYDMQSHSYKPLNPALFGNITSPVYTNPLGEVPTTLPPGKYRSTISALFYDTRTINFIIGPGDGQQFPTVYLTYNPLNPLSLLKNVTDFALYITTALINTLHVIASSNRAFDILAVIIICFSVILTFLLFLLKTRILFRRLPHFVVFHWHLLLQQHKQKYYFGGVTDDTNSPLGRTQIDVEDVKTKTILTHISTNASGKFYLRNQYEHAIDLVFVKPGYAPATIRIQKDMEIPDTGLRIVLNQSKHQLSIPAKLITALEEVFGMFFETSMVLALILEIMFFSVFGFAATVPFFTLSLVNIILWLLYLRERTSQG